jgi:hypothetical protein
LTPKELVISAEIPSPSHLTSFDKETPAVCCIIFISEGSNLQPQVACARLPTLDPAKQVLDLADRAAQKEVICVRCINMEDEEPCKRNISMSFKCTYQVLHSSKAVLMWFLE